MVFNKCSLKKWAWFLGFCGECNPPFKNPGYGPGIGRDELSQLLSECLGFNCFQWLTCCWVSGPPRLERLGFFV